jgi:hypothetical protein
VICQQQAALISFTGHLFSVTVNEQDTLEQRVFLYATDLKYGFARKRRRKFLRKFHDGRVPSRQSIHNLVNKLRTTGLLIDKKTKHKRRVITEELDDTGARLKHTPRKSLKRVPQETAMSESSATQLLKSSRESWYLVFCRGKKECCTCVFNETINCRKYVRVERTAFSTHPVICEL